MSYFDDLAGLLRERGVHDAEIEGTVADLAAYAAESGADPAEEFGPAAEFADQLTAGSETSGEPGAEAETWRFHADAFNEVRLLNDFGDQGWELQSYDMKAGFTLTRDLGRPQRWEYHREMAPAFRRRAVAARLAPEGWELAFTWTVWMYFKRPRSASLGPAGELAETPEAPGRHILFSKRFYVFGTIYTLLVIALAVGWILAAGDTPMAVGFLVGAAIGGFSVLLLALRKRD